MPEKLVSAFLGVLNWPFILEKDKSTFINQKMILRHGRLLLFKKNASAHIWGYVLVPALKAGCFVASVN